MAIQELLTISKTYPIITIAIAFLFFIISFIVAKKIIKLALIILGIIAILIAIIMFFI